MTLRNMLPSSIFVAAGGSTMSVKASVSITEQQNAFARDLVAKGRYSSISAVVQQGIEMLREETSNAELDQDALRTLLLQRMKGPFISMEDARKQTEQMLAEKKKLYGLPD
jgi:antitoxin ParD1/3/4